MREWPRQIELSVKNGIGVPQILTLSQVHTAREATYLTADGDTVDVVMDETGRIREFDAERAFGG